uniref:leukocyte elastase inhibitor B-like n=1 Tax=Semicossyphus pulcher TaxID=241346 RepID=UPI0037E8D0A8
MVSPITGVSRALPSCIGSGSASVLPVNARVCSGIILGVWRGGAGKIKDILAPGVVDSSTALVLINAIYFKGTWRDPFRKRSTVDDLFRMNKTDTKPVKMMQQKTWFSFASIPEAKIKVLEMPYKGMELSMLIILPNEIEDDTTGLEKVKNHTHTHRKHVLNRHTDNRYIFVSITGRYPLESWCPWIGAKRADGPP